MTGKVRDSRIDVRVAIVLEFDRRVLLARHEKGGRSYWVFPGGRLRYGETLEECGRRELREEANIDIRVGPLLYVCDRTSSRRQDVNVFFRGYPAGGEPRLGSDPEDPRGEVLKEIALVTADELRRMNVLPAEVKDAVLEDWESNFPAGGRYLAAGS